METPEMPQVDSSPSRYIEKVSLLTGEVLDDEIEPKRLLVETHRDYHVVDVQARRFMSRLVATTGDEELARDRMREVRRAGKRAADALAKATGSDPEKVSKALFGLKRREYYFRFKKHSMPLDGLEWRIGELRREAEQCLEAVRDEDSGHLRLRVLLTGGTGFVGKEIIWQVARDPDVAEMIVLIRPKVVRDRKSKEPVRTLSPADRGETLLDHLGLIEPELRAKFRFIAGDVEQPRLGIAADDLAELARTVTHVIHCAASVAFDDPYEKSFQANVLGTLNALQTSLGLQESEGSPFVAHLGIETSYIHGRQTQERAREDEIVFPKNFYNNYYELTKAMASIETEGFMLERGLRVVQLCPAIVIGASGTGNNRGDTKVVNAPVNVFGRAHQALTDGAGSLMDRSKASMIARMACVFPGDPSAELNLIPVDWVVQGIVAALKQPRAVAERVHLATDNRLTSQEIRDIVQEEIGVDVRLAEPTFHRTVTLPMLAKTLRGFSQDRLAKGLEKLGAIFGGYSEWGQPVHEVGRDVELLGLPLPRPDTRQAFRMLCRHNQYVQEFGKIRDDVEITRREQVWERFIRAVETDAGEPAGALSAEAFQQALGERVDLEAFELRG